MNQEEGIRVSPQYNKTGVEKKGLQGWRKGTKEKTILRGQIHAFTDHSFGLIFHFRQKPSCSGN